MTRTNVLCLAACAALTLSACASAPKPSAQRPTEQDDAADLRVAASPPVPATRKLRLVGKQPPASDYRFVGKVDGRAVIREWVETARSARADLHRKAVALGADLVKIDRVLVPDAGQHGRLVLLTGRAYRARFTD